MKILVIAEHDNKTLKQATLSTITAAQSLGSEIDLLICGYQCDPVVSTAKELNSLKRIRIANHSVYEHQLAENYATLITKIASEYDYILAPATTFGKNLLPRVAALMDTNVIADVIEVISPDTFARPIYAGNAVATVQSAEKIKFLTIRTTAFSPTTNTSGNNKPGIEQLDIVIDNELSSFVSQELTISERPDLTAAKIIISGGRGLKSADNFKLLEAIADKLGAAIGASRAAVDAGFAPNDYQVGQTGKIVAPDLYIAIGISGAIQHLAGMKDSKVVVAINNDPEAPIFEVADYGLVGDLFTVIPELKMELEK